MRLAGLLSILFLVPFFATASDFEIEKECGEKVPKIVAEVVKIGSACLAKLDGDGAKENRKRFAALLLAPPKIFCTRKDYQWEGAYAYATLPGDKGHPLIALNPSTFAKLEDEKLRGTLFHEMFHNMGYGHFSSVEYPYACQTCCFPEKELDDASVVKAACAVCRSAYKSHEDKTYLKDLVPFYELTYRSSQMNRTMSLLLEKYPDDRDIRFYFGRSMHWENLPFALGFRDQLKEAYQHDRSEPEKAFLEAVYLLPVGARDLIPAGRHLGKAYFAILEKRFKEAETALADAKAALPAKIVPSEENDRFVKDLKLRIERYAWLVYDHYRAREKAAKGVLERLEAVEGTRRADYLIHGHRYVREPWKGEGIFETRRKQKIDVALDLAALSAAIGKKDFGAFAEDVRRRLAEDFIGVPKPAKATLKDESLEILYQDEKHAFTVTIGFLRREKELVDYTLLIDGK